MESILSYTGYQPTRESAETSWQTDWQRRRLDRPKFTAENPPVIHDVMLRLYQDRLAYLVAAHRLDNTPSRAANLWLNVAVRRPYTLTVLPGDCSLQV